MFLDLNHRYEHPVLAQAFNVWVDIHAPIETVFAFLTEETKLNRWWTSKCTSDPRPGGLLHCVWHNESQITGDAVYRQCEPPTRLVVEWTHSNGELIRGNGDNVRGMRWPALNLYELVQWENNSTRLHVHDFGIDPSARYQQIRKATGHGWIESLALLKQAAELGYRQNQAKMERSKKSRTPEPDRPPKSGSAGKTRKSSG